MNKSLLQVSKWDRAVDTRVKSVTLKLTRTYEKDYSPSRYLISNLIYYGFLMIDGGERDSPETRK